MSQFQSYLVVSQDNQTARKQTEKLASELGINLQKVSPDVFFITPPKKEVVIAQIRDLKAHIHQKPLQYQHKFVVIEMAHTMAQEAQNALLKVLEEPPTHAIIVLEAKNKSQILPTIRSRTVILSPSKTSQTEQKAPTLLEQDLEIALDQITQISDPEGFLDDQIISLTDLLVDSTTRNKGSFSSSKIASAIEKCKDAREMITANVNANFVLANLAISLNAD